MIYKIHYSAASIWYVYYTEGVAAEGSRYTVVYYTVFGCQGVEAYGMYTIQRGVGVRGRGMYIHCRYCMVEARDFLQ